MTDYESTLAWLLTMARNPGFRNHAWFRAKELAKDESGLWPDMDKRLAEAMKDQGNETRGQG